jgi:hypothetical protein
MDQTWTMFLIFAELCLWNALLGNSFGILLGSMVTGIKTIVQLITIFFVPFVLMAGFVVNTGTLGVTASSPRIFQFHEIS